MDIVRVQYYFVFIFANLMQIEEKMHVLVTIPFPDDLMTLMKTYIICIVFMNGMFPGYTFFMTDTKNKEHVS